MATNRTPGVINDLVGSVQIFSSVLEDLMEERLDEVAKPRLTLPQIKLLRIVAASEGMTISSVASLLRVSNAAASKAVEKLVRRKILRRTEAPSDRRAIQLSLTPTGKRILEEFAAAKERALGSAFEGFQAAELRRTVNVLDSLSTSIVSNHPQPEEVCFRCGIHFQDKCLMREVAERICSYDLHTKDGGDVGERVREGKKDN